MTKILQFILLSSLAYSSFANDLDQQDDGIDNDVAAKTPKNYTYNLSVDKDMSAFSGADISMSLIEGYRVIENKLDPQNFGPIGKFAAFLLRNITLSTVTTFQHEVFGHGARLREFGWRITNYTVDFGGGGSTSYIPPKQRHTQKDIVVGLGGMQADEVLSNTIKSRMISNGEVNPTYGAAYFHSAFDQPHYVLLTKYRGRGHDVKDYINRMNTVYGAHFLTRSKVRSKAYLDLVDPFMYFGLYSNVTGQTFEYPTFNIGGIGYLPAMRGVLTPYGLESKLINYIKYDDVNMQINFTYGKNAMRKSYATQLVIDKIYSTDNVSVGIDTTVWKQPRLFYSNPQNAPTRIGGSAILNSTVSLNDTFGITLEGGYKTAGYQIGRPVASTALARVGIQLNF